MGTSRRILAGLKGQDKPTDDVAYKVWKLLQTNFNRQKLVEGLKLLSDEPWTTTAAEQSHCMAACVRRAHHELGLKSLISRAFIGGIRKLQPGSSM